MSKWKLQAPVRKRVSFEKVSPFPVPIQSITGQPAAVDNWYHYTGYLVDDHVEVRHTGDMDRLYKMGFFGKGNLSRHRPEYNQGPYYGAKRKRAANSLEVKVISRRKYLRHLFWKEELERDDGKESYQLEGEEFSALPKSKKVMGQHTEQQVEESEIDRDEQLCFTQASPDNMTHCTEHSNVCGWTADQETGEATNSDWPIEEEKDMWSLTDAKTSKDFWGLPETTTQTLTGESDVGGDARSNPIQDCDTWKESSKGPQIVTSSEIPNQNIHETSEKWDWEPLTQLSSRTESKSIVKQLKEREFQLEVASAAPQSDSKSPISQTAERSQERTDSALDAGLADGIQAVVRDEKDQRNSDVNISPPEKIDHDLSINDAIDPRCLEEESQGDFLVVDDSDDSDYEWGPDRKKWLPVRKHDPFSVKEHLQLAPEEAFFLSYGLGCLLILDDTQSPLNLTQLWEKFCAVHQYFLPKYIAYHYFRSKGWVPKVGLKFGADYVLYKDGPPFYHSSFSVIVRPVSDDNMKEDPLFPQTPLTWRSLSALNRVTEQTSKEVMLCYVIRPSSLTEAELKSPECIKHFKVKEVLVKRWISTKERERECDSEIS